MGMKRIICFLFGHKKPDVMYNGITDFKCQRCGKYIFWESRLGKWK